MAFRRDANTPQTMSGVTIQVSSIQTKPQDALGRGSQPLCSDTTGCRKLLPGVPSGLEKNNDSVKSNIVLKSLYTHAAIKLGTVAGVR